MPRTKEKSTTIDNESFRKFTYPNKTLPPSANWLSRTLTSLIVIVAATITGCGGGGGTSDGGATGTTDETAPPITSGLSLLAGNFQSASGFLDDTGKLARFHQPEGIRVDSSGNSYVADRGNHVIRKIDPMGVVTTLAGTPGVPGYKDGPGNSAQFDRPSSVAVDLEGIVYVADYGNDTIRKISPDGTVTTLAGTPSASHGSDSGRDGIGTDARFFNPWGVAVDQSGNVYVSDYNNWTIRKITASGSVTTLAGKAREYGSVDDTGVRARFRYVMGIDVDSSGTVYVIDQHSIRKITSDGVVTTVAGSQEVNGFGYLDGNSSSALFNSPTDVSIGLGNNLYIADTGNRVIRKITPSGDVTTVVGTQALNSGIRLGPLPAQLDVPRSVVMNERGQLLISTGLKNAILVATPTADGF